uniref:Uncharacterized protein n=1 Tax=Oryza sativa subsp. japonica TaxID=39947 RepID=Q69SV4_ORYSJ|nr:hypothetical protein [Oryza sativa Japonica Group]
MEDGWRGVKSIAHKGQGEWMSSDAIIAMDELGNRMWQRLGGGFGRACTASSGNSCGGGHLGFVFVAIDAAVAIRCCRTPPSSRHRQIREVVVVPLPAVVGAVANRRLRGYRCQTPLSSVPSPAVVDAVASREDAAVSLLPSCSPPGVHVSSARAAAAAAVADGERRRTEKLTRRRASIGRARQASSPAWVRHHRRGSYGDRGGCPDKTAMVTVHLLAGHHRGNTKSCRAE